MKNVIVIVGIIAAVAIYNFVFVDSDEVLEYNNKIVGLLGTATKAGESMEKTLEPFYTQKKVNIDNLKTKKEAAQKTVSKVFNEIKNMEVPKDKLCQDFHAAILSFTENKLTLVMKYDKLLEFGATHNPITDEDIPFITELFKKENDKSEGLSNKVVALQIKMAKEYNIKLK